MANFARGFGVGYGVGRSVRDRWDDYQMSKELDQMDPQADVAKGTGLRITGPEGETSTAVITPDSGGNLGEITKQYQDAGYKVEQTEQPQYAVRTGSRDLGVYDNEKAAVGLQRSDNFDRSGREAKIYEKYRKFDDARRIRREAGIDRRLDTQEDRSAESHAQNMEAGRYRLDEAKHQAAEREKMDMFNTDAAQLGEQGVLKSAEDWRKLMTQHGLSQAQQWDVIGKKLDIDTKMAQESQRLQLQAFKDAWKQGGIEGVLELYNKSPLFGDGESLKLQRGKNGFAVLDGKGDQVAAGASVDEVGALLYSRLQDPTQSLQLTMSVGKHNMDMRKGEADIQYKDRAGRAALADAGKRGDGQSTRLQVEQAKLLQSQAANLRKLAEAEPDARKRAMMLGEADVLAEQAREVYSPQAGGFAPPPMPGAPSAAPAAAKPPGLQRRQPEPPADPLAKMSKRQIEAEIARKEAQMRDPDLTANPQVKAQLQKQIDDMRKAYRDKVLASPD